MLPWFPPAAVAVRQDQAEWEALAKEVGAGGDARIVLRHDEAMSHRIFAASDMLLVPSMFEPCGLTQVRGAGVRVALTIVSLLH